MEVDGYGNGKNVRLCKLIKISPTQPIVFEKKNSFSRE